MNQINLEETLEIGPSTPTWFVCTCEDIARIGRHACGFINSEGGTIICGIEENGTVKGVKNAEQLSRKIEEDLLINLRPRSIIALEHKNYKNKDLIIIEIPMGIDKPYGYRDEIYIRRHKRNEKAGIDDIREMIISKSIEPERWERRLSLLMDARDIDKKLLMKAVSIVRKKGLPLQSTTDPYLIMSDLDLARDGSYTQGGDVLFSLNPVKRFPQVRVKATHFSGDKTSDTYLENVVFDGPLIQTLEKCLDFIIRNTPRKSVFPRTKLQREDVSMFPIPALREGLVNAFAHRDYAAYGGGIAINIFLNRLEIWNAGSLPAGFTPDDMTKPHASILVNPDIAHVLFLCEYMEKVGRGSLKIIEECKTAGLKAPSWDSSPAKGVTLTLYAGQATMDDTMDDTTDDTMDDAMDDTTDVSKEVMRLCSILAVPLGRKEIQEKLKLNNAEHVRLSYISPALDSGYIVMTIPEKPKSKNQRYRLTHAGKQLIEKLRSTTKAG